MNDIKLSKDADLLICLIYKHYLQLHDNGISKIKAKELNSVYDFHFLVPDWSIDDLYDTCLELKENNLLSAKTRYISDNRFKFYLSNTAIVYMENRFKNGIKEIANFITSFIP